MRRSPLRIAATLALAVAVVTCTDVPTSPHALASGKGGAARVAVVPQFSASAAHAWSFLASIGLTIDNIHLVLVRPPSQTLVDTVVTFPAGADSVSIDLTVQLLAATEQLTAYVELRSGNTVVFSGTEIITATVTGSGAPTTPAVIPLSYVGPGSTARSLRLSPRDTSEVVGSQQQYVVTALDSAGHAVTNIPIAFTTSDSTIARLSATGLATALHTGAATIAAASPNGLTDHVNLQVVNPPSKLVVTGGGGQTGTVGRSLPLPVVVQVLGGDGNPVPGIGVTFSAVSGGSVSPTSAITDATGHASTTPTLGNTSGSYTYQAAVSGLAPVTVTATASAGTPVGLAIVSGNAQADTVGRTLSQALVVRAVDSLGNAVSNASVTWARTSGVGTPSASATVTGADGRTSVSYTLGSTAGTDSVRANLTGVSLAGSAVVFTETGRSASPSGLTIASGNGQSGVVGAALAAPLVVQVKDTRGNAVAGAVIDWSVTSGTGTVGSAKSTSDSLGHASVTFMPGTHAGIDSVRATVDGSAVSVTFAATGLAGAPAVMVKVAGDSQTTVVGTAVPVRPAVKITDANGNGVAGATVTFAVTSGGGSITGASQVTDATGLATIGGWTVGATAGANALSAASGPLTVRFSATGVTAGARRPFKFYTDTTRSHAPLRDRIPYPDSISLQLQDSLGIPIRQSGIGVTVSFGGPGAPTITAGGSLSTDTSGTVNLHGLTVQGKAGTYTLTLTAATTPPVIFSHSTPFRGGAVTRIVPRDTVTSYTLTVAQPIPARAPSVRAYDVDTNGVDGVFILWRASGPPGVVSIDTIFTDTTGVSSITGRFPPFAAVGADTVQAATGPDSFITFYVTVTPGTAHAVVLVNALPATVQSGVAFPVQPVLQITDVNGNPVKVAGDSLFAQTSTNGVGLSGVNVITDTAGRGHFTSLTANTAATSFQIQFCGVVSLSLQCTGLQTIAVGASTPRTASVVVTPHLDTLVSLGSVFNLAAQAKDSAGNNLAGSFTWVSRTPSVATVNSAGAVTAVANGSSWVVATDTSGKRDSSLTVVQQRVATVNVTPGAKTIYLSKTFTFTAAAVDGLGHPIAGSPTFTWASNNSSVATVTSAGVVTGSGLGSAQISATTGGISGTSNVTILTPITRIVVQRDSANVFYNDTTTLRSLGITRTFVAQAYDTANALMAGVTFTWSSTNGSVAALDSITANTARATSAANGLTSLTATAQGVTGSTNLNVAQVLASIQLTPASVSVAPGGSIGLVARGVDANSRFISGGTFSYLSANASIATVSAGGVVTGVANGSVNITASFGTVTSNAALVTVTANALPQIKFGRDTLSVGRGSSASIPVLLSRPSGGNVTVKLSVRDTFAYFNPTSVTIPAGQTSANATLFGHNAGTTKVFAVDSLGTYAADSSVLAVQATIRLASGSFAINTNDQVSSQVLMSDPSPAGGTYVTFSFGTPNIASVSPNPAFIPAGQLAANIVIQGVGTGSTTITPSAIGVNGTASSFTGYAPNLTLSNTSLRLGQGQNQPNLSVTVPTYTNTAIPITLTSSDSTIVSVPQSLTIPAGVYYTYFSAFANGVGTATITMSSPGWTASNSMTVTSTTPHVAVCCAQTLNTTSPQFAFSVYAEDSTLQAHDRTNSLVVHVSSSNPAVLTVLDTVVTVQPGAYYNNGRVIPGGSGGTAYVKVTAGGHTSDSTLYTVVGPKLALNWPGSPVLGSGQFQPGFYVSTPNNVNANLQVTLTSSDTTKASLKGLVTVPTNSYYAYDTVTANAVGTISIIATAPGYQPDTLALTVTTPHLVIQGGGTLAAFAPPQTFTVYAADSLRQAHYRTTALHVSFVSRNPAVVSVDTGVTIPAGSYYANTQQVTANGAGTTWVVATAAGQQPDSVSYTVINTKVGFSTRSYVIGARQRRNPGEFYVYTQNIRTSPLVVTITNKHSAILSVSAAVDTIQTGTNVSYFTFSALAEGVDTLVSAAAGYLPDTMFVTVNRPALAAQGIPSTATTTTPPFTTVIYAEDSTLSHANYASDTVVIKVASSDTTVIKPTHPYMHILAGLYYGYDTINVVGPGAANLTYTDSATTGITYLSSSTNNVTVTGPSLAMNTANVMLGMRQTTGAGYVYVQVPNSVGAPLPITLVSSSTRVATVPAVDTIPAGFNYVYFPITALDTVGTIQIQASAPGYNPTSLTVQVTQPKFLLLTTTTANTTSPRRAITIYATDANGTTHYATEAVAVSLSSSAPSVASMDSSTVTIPQGSYYNNAATWGPGAAGTTLFTAADSRAAFYKYNPATQSISVSTPSLGFNWSSTPLGLGQYIDNQYVYTPDNQTSNVAVTLTHNGVAHTTTVPSGGVTITSGNSSANFRLIGTSSGTDTLVASATSPAHNPATAYTMVDSGRVDPLSGWPSTLTVGDSVLITLYARDPAQNVRNVLAATTWTLSSNANIQFVLGGSTVTSVTIPAGAQYIQFYIKAVSSGTGSATVTAPSYKAYSNTVTVP